MRQETIFTVEAPATLLEFLLAQVKGQSRNSVKHLLSRGQVLIDNQPQTKFDHLLRPGDRVTILPQAKGASLPFPVLYEDEGLIVIDKPAGLLSVATEKEKYRTAYRMTMDYLRARDPAARIFIVHRLDRDTSGVLLFAKDAKLKLALQDSWNTLVQKRGYWAVVEGSDLPDNGVCRTTLQENKAHRVYSAKGEVGKEAVTRYQTLARRKDYTLLDVEIDTGRKNQIRAHLSELKHPVAGDKAYHAATDPIHRLALHAYALTLTDPRTKKQLALNAPAPDGFRRLFPKEFKQGVR